MSDLTTRAGGRSAGRPLASLRRAALLGVAAVALGGSVARAESSDPYSHARAIVDGKIKPWDARGGPPDASVEFIHLFDHATTRPPLSLRLLNARPDAYRSKWGPPSTVLLGDMLFHAPRLLGEKTAPFGLSCDSCHPNGGTTRDLFFPGESDRPGNIDLLSPARIDSADDGLYAPRNVPSLRGVRYLGPYLHDGSKGSIAEVVEGVVATEFGQQVPRPWLSALTTYVTQLDFLPNPNLDDLGALTDRASPAAKRGAALFRAARPQLDGASCATCHIPASFFTDHLPHRFRHGEGAGTTSPGESFVTATLVNIAESPPYFFDGSAPTLARAVERISTRHKLGLTAAQAADLTAYLEAVGAVEGKPYKPTPQSQFEGYLVYLDLCLDGPYRDDPAIWSLTLETVRHGLRDALTNDAQPREAAALEPLVARFEALARGDAAHPGDEAREKLSALRGELLAAVHLPALPDPSVARRLREASIQQQK